MNVGIIDTACFFPGKKRLNSFIVDNLGKWTDDEIYSKVGIAERSIASEDEFASDLSVKAANILFEKRNQLKEAVDLLIVCTQTPDYSIPTTACIVHKKMGFRENVASFDINLGCSGFVYTLSVARSMILSGDANLALICCADTYTKHIACTDGMTLPVFGDAGSATLVGRLKDGVKGIGKFHFGTDGQGWNQLIVPSSGCHSSLNSPKLPAADSHLYMNGPEIFRFTTQALKLAFTKMEEKFKVDRKKVEWVVLHQASALVLRHIISSCGLIPERTPIYLKYTGNIVSSSIPYVITQLVKNAKIRKGDRVILFGFGVGYSWAGAYLEWNKKEDFILDNLIT